jgi:hypothetical protein
MLTPGRAPFKTDSVQRLQMVQQGAHGHWDDAKDEFSFLWRKTFRQDRV